MLQELPDARPATWMDTATSYENRTHWGDLIIENGTYLIENMEFHLFGKLSVRHEATVVARDATFVLSPEGGVSYREAIVLEHESRFIAENLTVVFQPLSYSACYIVVDDEAQLNIADSQLSGWGHIIARHHATVYMENGTLESLKPEFEGSGVIAEDNAFARVQNSKLDVAGARGESSILILNSIVQPEGAFASGKGTVEIENSDVGYSEELRESSTLRIADSTIDGMSLGGGVLHVHDSQIRYSVRISGDCTAWFIGTMIPHVSAQGNSTVWLINSAAKEIKTFDEARVNVGWQLPVLGTFTVPHTWVPILQAVFIMVALLVIITILVLVNKQWKRWRTKKMGRGAISARAERRCLTNSFENL